LWGGLGRLYFGVVRAFARLLLCLAWRASERERFGRRELCPSVTPHAQQRLRGAALARLLPRALLVITTGEAAAKYRSAAHR